MRLVPVTTYECRCLWCDDVVRTVSIRQDEPLQWLHVALRVYVAGCLSVNRHLFDSAVAAIKARL